MLLYCAKETIHTCSYMCMSNEIPEFPLIPNY